MQLPLDDVEDTNLAVMNVNISLAILQAVVVLVGDKVELLESLLEVEKVYYYYYFFILFYFNNNDNNN